MNHLKMTCLVAVVAAGLTAFAAPASATTPTSPEGTTYTGTVKGESNNVTLHGAFVSVKCGHSTAEASVSQHGSSITAGSKVTSLTFTECNYAATVSNGGSTEVHANGAYTSTGISVTVHTSVGSCIFTTNATQLGIGTDTKATGSNAEIDFNSAKIPRTGGNFLCGSSATLTGNFTITTPSTLFLD